MSASENTIDLQKVLATPQEVAASKIRVKAKAQNRTALGIMHAYMTLYPKTTIEELRQAFPNSLNPDSGVGINFLLEGEQSKVANFEGYFSKEEEMLTLGDGRKAKVVMMWTKASLIRLIAHAKQYHIVVTNFEAVGKKGEKGGFELEYLNGYTPAAVAVTSNKTIHTPKVEKTEKRGTPGWVWPLVAVVLALLIVWLRPKEVVEVEKEVIVEKVIRDTVYVKQLENIQREFNNVQFEQGKADLRDEAKFVLYDLQKLMEKNTDVRVKITGHTSSEGNPQFNLKLSEARAKAAVDFLISRGIDASRLEYEGKGSTEPLDTQNQEMNRRTEFRFIE